MLAIKRVEPMDDVQEVMQKTLERVKREKVCVASAYAYVTGNFMDHVGRGHLGESQSIFLC